MVLASVVANYYPVVVVHFLARVAAAAARVVVAATRVVAVVRVPLASSPFLVSTTHPFARQVAPDSFVWTTILSNRLPLVRFPLVVRQV